MICCGNKIIYWGNNTICCGNKICFLWEQDIILKEQNNFLFLHGLNPPPYHLNDWHLLGCEGNSVHSSGVRVEFKVFKKSKSLFKGIFGCSLFVRRFSISTYMFNICQHSLLPFNTYLLKYCQRLNERFQRCLQPMPTFWNIISLFFKLTVQSSTYTEKLQGKELIKLYTIYTSTVSLLMKLAGRTDYLIYISNKFT